MARRPVSFEVYDDFAPGHVVYQPPPAPAVAKKTVLESTPVKGADFYRKQVKDKLKKYMKAWKRDGTLSEKDFQSVVELWETQHEDRAWLEKLEEEAKARKLKANLATRM